MPPLQGVRWGYFERGFVESVSASGYEPFRAASAVVRQAIHLRALRLELPSGFSRFDEPGCLAGLRQLVGPDGEAGLRVEGVAADADEVGGVLVLQVGAEVRVGAGAEVVDDDIGALHQAAKDVDGARVLHVERHAVLVAIPQNEEWVVVVIGTDGAFLGLQLDHLGAEIAEHARPERTGQHPGEVEHAHTLQRLVAAGRGGNTL